MTRKYKHGKKGTNKMKPKRYNDYGAWLRTMFPYKVQKISVDAGMTCPNRDGRIGTGGCIYCNNQSFNPSYCQTNSPHTIGGSPAPAAANLWAITRQLEEGKRFFARKYPEMRYLAYFQAYTNTDAPLATLQKMYEEALAVPGVEGIIIGTRPDCVTTELLDYLAELSRRTFVVIEYGIETANDDTLRRINRGHTFDCVRRTVTATAERGILCGGHVILGLPGEDAAESLRQAPIISGLPLTTLKIHQLQIIRHTPLERMHTASPLPLYGVDEYITLITEYIRLLRPDLVLERFVSQSPADLLVAPRWGLKNHEFTNLLNNHLEKVGARQGDRIDRQIKPQ